MTLWNSSCLATFGPPGCHWWPWRDDKVWRELEAVHVPVGGTPGESCAKVLWYDLLRVQMLSPASYNLSCALGHLAVMNLSFPTAVWRVWLGGWQHLTPHSSEVRMSKWGLGAVREVTAQMSCLLNKQYFSPVAKCFEPLDWNIAVSGVNAYFTAHPRNWFGQFQIEGFSICPGLDDSCNFQGLLTYISMKKLPRMWFRYVGRNQLLSLGWFRGESKPTTQ